MAPKVAKRCKASALLDQVPVCKLQKTLIKYGCCHHMMQNVISLDFYEYPHMNPDDAEQDQACKNDQNSCCWNWILLWKCDLPSNTLGQKCTRKKQAQNPAILDLKSSKKFVLSFVSWKFLADFWPCVTTSFDCEIILGLKKCSFHLPINIIIYKSHYPSIFADEMGKTEIVRKRKKPSKENFFVSENPTNKTGNSLLHYGKEIQLEN